MEGSEGVRLVRLGKGEKEGVVDACERVFRVGELVEFWGGPAARAYLTDSGAPAYVKEIHGLGWYGIKMVGSFGGKNRRVHWTSLFKDSTFTKQVVRLEGATVRTKARMEERAQDEAEAKMGDELRETRRKLQIQVNATSKKDNEKKEMEKEGEDRLKNQEKQARNAAKDLTNGHKRELAELRGDLERQREEEIKVQEELGRAVRQKTRQITRDLEQTQQDLIDKTQRNEALDKAFKKGVQKLDGVRDDGLRWKSKYVAEKEEVRLREERIVAGALELRDLGRSWDTEDKRNCNLVGELRAQLALAGGQAQV